MLQSAILIPSKYLCSIVCVHADDSWIHIGHLALDPELWSSSSPEYLRKFRATVKPLHPERILPSDKSTRTKMKPKTPAKGVKRQRSASPSPSSKSSSQSNPPESALAKPSRSVKKAKVQKASSPKTGESAASVTIEKAEKAEKATKAKAADADKAIKPKATKAETAKIEKERKAEATKLEKARKANEKQWKQDWKIWFTDPANQTSATFQRTPNDDLVNVKESATVYGIKREELNCLRHCNAPNPHGPYFTPMKLFVKAEVQDLAFRKEGILAGVSQDDEVGLLRRGKEVFEEKNG